MLRPLVVAMAIATCAAPAMSSMVLDRTIIRFDADGPARQDVQIANTGEETLYLQVDVLEVRNPGTEREEQVRASDPDAIRLLATPSKMILPGGSRKLMRLVNLAGNDDAERIFRVNVRPVVGELSPQGMAVKVVVAYQLLVIVPPTHPAPNLAYAREGTQITFRNEGNTNVLLHGGEQCPPASSGADTCTTLEAHRLYAGNRWQLSLPYDAPLEYSITIGDDNSRRRFD